MPQANKIYEPLPLLDLNVEEEVQQNTLVTSVDQVLNWARRSSLWPCMFGLACCAMEMIATATPRYDIARFGAEIFRASPRQADLLLVPGTVTWKMAPAVRRIWLQMPEPKWCISMGACASSGGVFDTYCTVQGIDRFLPVDVYVPGCPPRPEQLIRAVLDIQEKVTRTGTMDAREFANRNSYEGPTSLAQELAPEEAIVAPGNYRTATRLRVPLN